MKKCMMLLLSVLMATSYAFIPVSANTSLPSEGKLSKEEVSHDQYEDFGGELPKFREYYYGFQRDSQWHVSYGGRSYIATARKGNGTAAGIYYVPGLNRWISGDGFDSGENITEVVDIAPRRVTFSKARPLHSEPFFRTKFSSIPAGTYTVYKVGCEWMYIEYAAGKFAWVCANYGPNDAWEADSEANFEGVPEYLSVNAIRNIPLIKKIIPIRKNNRANTPMVPAYVTIHNTASTGRGADALSHANLQYSGNGGAYSSWHFTVDDHSIYQSIPLNEIAYHAGDGMSQGNGRTVAIEICENADGNYAQAERNAALLTARILFDLGLPADAIKRHYDWSGKDCPHNMFEMTKGSMGWDGFKKAVADEYAKLESEAMEFHYTPPVGSEKYLTAGNLKYVNDTVYGIDLNMSPSELVKKIKNADKNAEVVMKDASGEIKTSGIIKTKDILEIKTEDGKTFVFTCLIKGDCNGDGKISAIDYVMLENHIVGIRKLQDVEFHAMNVNNDKKVSAIDYVMIENHILKIVSIPQY